MIYVFTIVFGLIVGSFLNVCIYRIPLGRKKGEVNLDINDQEQEDIVADEVTASTATIVNTENTTKKITVASPARSFCPECQKELYWYHNIPLFSWLFLKGRCAFCQVPISVRYPLVELLSALFALLSLVHFGLTPTAFVIYAFCAALIVISFIDYDYYIIPNVISIPGTVLGVVIAGINQFTSIFELPVADGLWTSAIGLLIGGGFLLAIAEFYIRVRKRVGLGLGDIKLLAMTGAFFGVQAAFYTIFVGSLLGSIFGVGLILARGRTATHPIPFGPYLAVATVLYLFVGFDLFEYLRLGMNQALSVF